MKAPPTGRSEQGQRAAAAEGEGELYRVAIAGARKHLLWTPPVSLQARKHDFGGVEVGAALQTAGQEMKQVCWYRVGQGPSR